MLSEGVPVPSGKGDIGRSQTVRPNYKSVSRAARVTDRASSTVSFFCFRGSIVRLWLVGGSNAMQCNAMQHTTARCNAMRCSVGTGSMHCFVCCACCLPCYTTPKYLLASSASSSSMHQSSFSLPPPSLSPEGGSSFSWLAVSFPLLLAPAVAVAVVPASLQGMHSPASSTLASVLDPFRLVSLVVAFAFAFVPMPLASECPRFFSGFTASRTNRLSSLGWGNDV
mmetsp:Transcript_25183/g.52292  ORF Transcript_25183/g.52292 Transcript_25183/m.52292 type:complete len:225 (+) Transcript_25183:42-716(+)